MSASMSNWRRTLGQKVRHMTPEQARAVLAIHGARGPHIGDPQYRLLTGGYSSQTIDTIVTRKLAKKAGIGGITAAEQRGAE